MSQIVAGTHAGVRSPFGAKSTWLRLIAALFVVLAAVVAPASGAHAGSPKSMILIGDSYSTALPDRLKSSLGADWGVTVNGYSGRRADQAAKEVDAQTSANFSAADLEALKTADVVVLELGTNPNSGDFIASMTQLVQKVRGINTKSAKIYWVNNYHTGSAALQAMNAKQNADMAAQAATVGITDIIKWDDTAKSHPDWFAADTAQQVHPAGGTGYDELAKLIAAKTTGTPVGGALPGMPNTGAGGAANANKASTNPGETALKGISAFVANGAIDAMRMVLGALNSATSVNVNSSDPGHFFGKNYVMLKSIAIWVMLPLVLVSTIHQVAKGSLQGVIKTYLVFMPIAFIGMVVATTIVQLLLNMTDQFAGAFQTSMGQDIGRLYGNITETFLLSGSSGVVNADPKAVLEGPTNVVIGGFLGLALMFGLIFACAACWIVLIMRQASVYLGTLFLPLGFAMLVWPSTAKYFRKLVEFLFAMIFSKVVMVAGISLSLAAMAGAEGSHVASGAVTLDNAASVAGDTFSGIAQIVQAIAMFLVVAFAPSMVMKFVGNLALGEMAGAVAQGLDKPSSLSQILFAGRVNDISRNTGAILKMRSQENHMNAWARATSHAENALTAMGIFGVRTYHGDTPVGDANYEITEKDALAAGLDRGSNPTDFDNVITWSRSQNPNEVAAAHAALAAGAAFAGFAPRGANDDHTVILTNVTDSHGKVLTTTNAAGKVVNLQDAHVVMDVAVNNDKSYRQINKIDPAVVRHAVLNTAANHNVQNIRVHTGLDTNNAQQNGNIAALRGVAGRVQEDLKRPATDPRSVKTLLNEKQKDFVTVTVASGAGTITEKFKHPISQNLRPNRL